MVISNAFLRSTKVINNNFSAFSNAVNSLWVVWWVEIVRKWIIMNFL